MPISQSRVVGSGFSVLRWQGQRIAFLETVKDDGQSPVAPVEAVQPLDEPYPIEFAVPKAMRSGSFSMSIRELWAKPVWQQLSGLENASDLLGVWDVMSRLPGTITCQTIIKPPQGGYWRLKTYHNVVITDIDDSETINIGSMTVSKSVTCAYTHSTRSVVTAGA
jgi:hypothetical protein